MIKRNKSQKTFEKESSRCKPGKTLFCLYIAGTTERSLRAVRRIKELCERELKGLYTLEVVDLYQQPARAIADQIVAAPTLVRQAPQPVRLVGDLSNDTKVLALFNLEARSPDKTDGKQEA